MTDYLPARINEADSLLLFRHLLVEADVVRTRHTITLALVAACGAALAGVWAPRWANSRRDAGAAPPDQVLEVQEGSNSFGDVWESRDFRWSFPVVNRGARTIAVESVIGSCTCLSVTPEQFTVPPGGTQVINVRIDFGLKAREDDHAAFSLRYLAADDTGRRHEGLWVITGRVRKFLALSSRVDFGRRSILNQPFVPLTVGARFGGAVEQVTVAPGDSPIRLAPIHNPPDAHCQFVASGIRTLPVGRVEGSVVVQLKLTSGEERTERIPVSADIVPDVELSPPAFPGGGRELGGSFEFAVTATSLTRTPFSVREVRAVGDGLTARAADGVWVVTQQCVATGDQVNRVEFDVDGGDGKCTLSLPVDYTGFPSQR